MGVYPRRRDDGIVVWYVSFFDPKSGKRIQHKAGLSKTMALSVWKKESTLAVEGKYFDVRGRQRIRFDEFCKKYFELYATPETKKSWHSDCDTVKVLKRFFGGRYLHEITIEDVRRFKTERAKEVKGLTVNRALALLRCMFNLAKDWGDFFGDNPVKGKELFFKEQGRLRFLEFEEIPKLLSVCILHLRPIVIMALNTGMRKGEILNLKWRDCDFKRNIIYLEQTKSGERQEVPMNEVARDTLIKVKKHPESEYIFCNKDGKAYGDIKKSFLTALEKAGIIKFRFHDLRHTFAAHWVMNGGSIYTLQKILRHSSLSITEKYAHLAPDYMATEVRQVTQKMMQATKKCYAGATSDNFTQTVSKTDFDKSLALQEI